MDEQQNLHEAGLKATLPRMKILELIRCSAQRHLTADDIYRRLQAEDASIALPTVYRVLAQLQQAGILARNTFDNGKAVFELDEGTHHDHMVCVACGQVEEFHDEAIEARQRAVAAARGFALQEHRLALYGLCARCIRS